MLENLHYYINIATAVISFASVVTAITPTPNDNYVLGKIYKVIEFLALVNKRTKQKG
jgi:hypothetical protein